MVYTFDFDSSLPSLASGLWWDAFTFWSETGAPDSGSWYLQATTFGISGGDVYDDVHVIAFSECEEELLVFATLNGIPLKADCQQS